MTEVTMEKLISLAKRRGFVFPGSEIYGGLAGTWDYGPLGVALKNNIKSLWWRMFVDGRDDMYGVDAAILMNPKAWEASGHVSGFSDPLVECSKCKKRFRADHVEQKFVKDDQGKIQEGLSIWVCGECGTENNFEGVRQFNMMFETVIGAVNPREDVVRTVRPILEELFKKAEAKEIPDMQRLAGQIKVAKTAMDGLDENTTYLRPETAGGIFVNFKNVVDTMRPKLPFGIGQIGKAFRNEIAPRDFIFRVRELEQMEIEYFVRPTEWETAFEEWRQQAHAFMDAAGIDKEKVHELEVAPEDLAHYSKRTIDFEFDFPFGRKELYGLAYRTDFDLSAHARGSGQNLAMQDKEGEPAVVPHVIEPSFGVDRTFLAILASVYREDELGGEPRTYLAFPKAVAPVKAAVFPLLKNKPELVAKAREVYRVLKQEQPQIMWDDNGNIGKRYRRQDEIGTPYCITIDFDTLGENGDELKDTVTMRDRDTGEQKRVQIGELAVLLK